MKQEALIHQLFAMRSQIDAILSELVEQQCKHPPDMRQTLPGDRYFCRACQQEVKEVE